MDIKIIKRKFQRNLVDYGSAAALKKGFLYLLKNIYINRVYRIYRIKLSTHQKKSIENNDFVFKKIDVNDTNIIQQIEKLEEWLTGALAGKLAERSICIAALDGETVAGFNVVSYGEVYIPLINQSRTFKKGHAWSDQVTVNPKYRRRGLGSSLRFKIFQELKSRGFSKLYGGTLLPNEANLRLSRKVGLIEIVDVKYLKIANRQSWQYKRVRNENS